MLFVPRLAVEQHLHLQLCWWLCWSTGWPTTLQAEMHGPAETEALAKRQGIFLARPPTVVMVGAGWRIINADGLRLK